MNKIRKSNTPYPLTHLTLALYWLTYGQKYHIPGTAVILPGSFFFKSGIQTIFCKKKGETKFEAANMSKSWTIVVELKTSGQVCIWAKDASLHCASEILSSSWYTNHWFYEKWRPEWSSMSQEKNHSPAIVVAFESMGREEELFAVPLLQSEASLRVNSTSCEKQTRL